MATWHQQRSKAPLYHQTKWTLLVDPPNALRYSYLFETEIEAQDAGSRIVQNGSALPQHCLILKPATQL